VARLLPAAMRWPCTRGGCCGLAFAELGALEAHARTHAPTCLQRKLIDSSTRVSLESHALQLKSQRKKHKQSKSKSNHRYVFLCPFGNGCGFSTDDEGHLQAHTKEHAEHVGILGGSYGAMLRQGNSELWAGTGARGTRSGCNFKATTARDLEEPVIRSKHVIRSSANEYCNDGPAGCEDAVLVTIACPWSECGFRTAQKRNLKAHIRTHTGEKPLRCAWSGCPYISARAGDMKEHSRTHTGEKPYRCQWQGCKYSSAQASNLKRHSLVHTGERPFPCAWDGCRYSSSTASNLKQHVQTHTRERPFGCTSAGCKYKAARATDLKKHARRVHPSERCRAATNAEWPALARKTLARASRPALGGVIPNEYQTVPHSQRSPHSP
jgi:hypothetical protein